MYAASLFISFVHNTSSLGPFCIVWSILMVLFYVFFFFKKREHVDWSNPRRDWQLGFFIPSVIFFRLLFV
jgi:hypothetical protein